MFMYIHKVGLSASLTAAPHLQMKEEELELKVFEP